MDMQSIQVGQLKSEFSTILNNVQNFGERYVIEYGRNHKKIAMIVPFEEENKKPRKFGIYEGKYKVPDDFDKEDEEISGMFYDGKIYP